MSTDTAAVITSPDANELAEDKCHLSDDESKEMESPEEEKPKEDESKEGGPPSDGMPPYLRLLVALLESSKTRDAKEEEMSEKIKDIKAFKKTYRAKYGKENTRFEKMMLYNMMATTSLIPHPSLYEVSKTASITSLIKVHSMTRKAMVLMEIIDPEKNSLKERMQERAAKKKEEKKEKSQAKRGKSFDKPRKFIEE